MSAPKPNARPHVVNDYPSSAAIPYEVLTPIPTARASAPAKRSSVKTKPPTPTFISAATAAAAPIPSKPSKVPKPHKSNPPASLPAPLPPPNSQPQPISIAAAPAAALSSIPYAVVHVPFLAGNRVVHPLLPPPTSLLPSLDLPLRFAHSDPTRLREAERYLAAYSAPEDELAEAVRNAVAKVDGGWIRSPPPEPFNKSRSLHSSDPPMQPAEVNLSGLARDVAGASVKAELDAEVKMEDEWRGPASKLADILNSLIDSESSYDPSAPQAPQGFRIPTSGAAVADGSLLPSSRSFRRVAEKLDKVLVARGFVECLKGAAGGIGLGEESWTRVAGWCGGVVEECGVLDLRGARKPRSTEEEPEDKVEDDPDGDEAITERVLEQVSREQWGLEAGVVAWGMMTGVASGGAAVGQATRRKLLPDSLLTSTLSLLQHLISSAILPAHRHLHFASSADPETLSRSANHLPRILSTSPKLRTALADLTSRLSDTLRLAARLMRTGERLAEHHVVACASLAVETLVGAAEGRTREGWTVGVEGAASAGAELMAALLHHYPGVRDDVLGEVVASMTKAAEFYIGAGGKRTGTGSPRAFVTPDGRSISAYSAAVMLCAQCVGVETEEGVRDWCGVQKEDWDTEFVIEIDERPGKLKKKKTEGTEVKDQKEIVKDVEKFLALLRAPLERSLATSAHIIRHLLLRSLPHTEAHPSPVKHKKRTIHEEGNEAGYRKVLEELIGDALKCVDAPEWPAAEWVVGVAAKVMLQHLDDKRTPATIAQLAVDVVGNITARLYSRRKELQASGWAAQVDASLSTEAKPKEKEEILKMWAAERKVEGWLKKGDDEGTTESARIFHLAHWLSGYVTLLRDGKASAIVIEKDALAMVNEVALDCSEALSTLTRSSYRIDLRKESETLPSLQCFLTLLNGDLANGTPSKSFNGTAADERPVICNLIGVLSFRGSLYHSWEHLLGKLVAILAGGSVQLRTKALRSLSAITSIDASLLRSDRVRNAVESCFTDASPAVRDAAVELISKYAVGSSDTDVTRYYYAAVALRMLDTGTNVRKRVVKFLKDAFVQFSKASYQKGEGISDLEQLDTERMVDASFRLIRATVLDEEETVRDLAAKNLQECWFSKFQFVALPPTDDVLDEESIAKSASKKRKSRVVEADHNEPTAAGAWNYSSVSPLGRLEVGRRAIVFQGTAARLQGVRSVEYLGDFVKRCLKGGQTRDADDTVDVARVCRVLTDHLVEEVVNAGGEADSKARDSVLGSLLTLQQLSRASPSLLLRHVVTLDIYLEIPDNGVLSKDEGDTVSTVLSIFTDMLPRVKQADRGVLNRMEEKLQKIISRVRISFVLSAAVPCLCRLVETQTRNYDRVAEVFGRVLERLSQLRAANEKTPLFGTGTSNVAPAVVRCLAIIGLVLRCLDLDQYMDSVQDEDCKELLEELSEITPSKTLRQRSFRECMSFVGSSVPPFVAAAAIEALGNIAIGQPSYLVDDTFRELIGNVFAGEVVELKEKVLGCFRDFLSDENAKTVEVEEKEKKDDGPVDRELLAGRTEKLGEAGIALSTMQMYLPGITDCLLSTNSRLRVVAFDVLAAIEEQGLVPPPQIIPALVAIETCDDIALGHRAQKVHGRLCEKFPSLLNQPTVFTKCIVTAYDFQAKSVKERKVCGYRQVDSRLYSFLQPMFELVRSRKKPRNDFLYSLVKIIDNQSREDSSKIDFTLSRFVAEALATLEYSTQEEVLTVIHYINQALGVTASTVVRFAELLDDGGDVEGDPKSSDSNSLDERVKKATVETSLSIELAAKMSICMGYLLALRKRYLQMTYDLKDQRVLHFKPSDAPRSTEKAIDKTEIVYPAEVTWDDVERRTTVDGTVAEWNLQTDEGRAEVVRNFHSMILSDIAILGEDDIEPESLSNLFGEGDGAAETGADVDGAQQGNSHGKKKAPKKRAPAKARASKGTAPKQRKSGPSKKRKRKAASDYDSEVDSAMEMSVGSDGDGSRKTKRKGTATSRYKDESSDDELIQ
ncbi:Sister chromatid cohesion protein 2 [Gonapodya sp. JEL0774]|nr:Sister chromatid cohesion protein 2 [Gonapodya sp. JEL0774]